MAQKQRRLSPLDEPPTASSSDSEDDHPPSSQHQDEEDDDEASSEEATSSEEDENEQQQKHRAQPSLKIASKIPPTQPTISHPKPSSSSSATESDSDSEPEPDTPVPNPKVKPLASKPMENNTPKAKALPSPAAPPRSGTKRSVENNAYAADPKRAKKKVTSVPVSAGAGSDEEVEEGKKLGEDPRPFQRVFSEEDEIVILKGMVEFTSKTGLDPYKNADQFYDFVKKSLHSGATSNQLKQKIRRLKKKFENNAGRGKNGEDPSFSKPHEQKSFELSKKLWAGEGVEKGKPNGKPAKSPKKEVSNKNVPSGKKLKPETKAVAEVVPSANSKEPERMEVDVKRDDSTSLLSEMFCFEKGVGLSGLLNEVAVKKGLDLIGASKRAELEGRWKELQISALELLEKRAQLIQDQARLILEAYKSSNN